MALLTLEQSLEKNIASLKDRVGLICAGVKQRERIDIIDAFTDEVDGETNTRRSKNNFQILVGTTRLIGTGLHLTRANNIVMMEPDYQFYRELQVIARIHRIKSKSDLTESYSVRPIDEGSEIEAKILRRQQDRGESFGREATPTVLPGVAAAAHPALAEPVPGDGTLSVRPDQ